MLYCTIPVTVNNYCSLQCSSELLSVFILFFCCCSLFCFFLSLLSVLYHLCCRLQNDIAKTHPFIWVWVECVNSSNSWKVWKQYASTLYKQHDTSGCFLVLWSSLRASLSVVCVTHNWPVVSSCLCWHCCCLGEAPDVFATVIKLSWSYASAASSCRKGLDVFSSCRRTSRPISFAQEVCDNKRPGYSLSI